MTIPLRDPEPCLRRIRAVLGGRTVLDTVAALYVWEVPYYPAWYVPVDDVHPELLALGSTTIVDGRARIAWNAVDEWLEEDVPVYVHPRSPYVRVDVLPSSRHVVVEIGGVVVAESRSPRFLVETGLPVRSYLPRTDVRLDLLEPSATTTGCPYKGWAEYSTVVLPDGRRFPDVVWGYRTPLPESTLVAGLLCFYDEKVDVIVIVDGVRRERPVTKFS